MKKLKSLLDKSLRTTLRFIVYSIIFLVYHYKVNRGTFKFRFIRMFLIISTCLVITGNWVNINTSFLKDSTSFIIFITATLLEITALSYALVVIYNEIEPVFKDIDNKEKDIKFNKSIEKDQKIELENKVNIESIPYYEIKRLDSK